MIRRVITFISFGNVAIIVSLVIIVAGGVAIYLFGGLALGIDFQSGVSLQVQFRATPPPTAEEVRTALDDFGVVSVQRITNISGRYVIKSDLAGEGDSATANALQQRLYIEFDGEENVEVLEVAFIGPRYSSSIARQSIILTISALALILIYIWIRFRLHYAVSAVVALVHDVLMTIVFLGVTRVELSTTTVAAILTIIGYSLNDTVVIFDRIRENSAIYKRDIAFHEIANTSIRQSLSRTLITSITTLLAVSAIYVFSTGSIQDFALCMIFGVVVGTYSSICVASPVLVSWIKRSARAARGVARVAARVRDESDGSGSAEKSGSGNGALVASAPASGSVGSASGGGKEITVNTARIRQELIAKRQQQQQKKKKKKK